MEENNLRNNLNKVMEDIIDIYLIWPHKMDDLKASTILDRR